MAAEDALPVGAALAVDGVSYRIKSKNYTNTFNNAEFFVERTSEPASFVFTVQRRQKVRGGERWIGYWSPLWNHSSEVDILSGRRLGLEEDYEDYVAPPAPEKFEGLTVKRPRKLNKETK